MKEDMYDFLQGFFNANPKYANNEFFIIGESYAGHYCPSLGAHILRQNEALPEAAIKINLAGVSIGNGLVDPVAQYPAYSHFAFDNGVIGKMTFSAMQAVLPACTTAIETCGDGIGIIGCDAAFLACNYGQVVPVQLSGLNPYDVREKCAVKPLCYDFSAVNSYFNTPEVQAQLGVNRHWSDCNHAVNLGGDWMHSTLGDVQHILESKVNMVIYAGEFDFICNWEGNYAWVDNMQWSGQEAWRASANGTWIVDGAAAGSAKETEHLSFVKVSDAGHMVPLNQPKAALDLLTRFLANKSFMDHINMAEYAVNNF